MTDREAFLLQRVQPAMVGLIDGSLSTLAPIFSVAVVTHKPHYAFIAGLATAFGAGISMAFSEGLSDTGELTTAVRPTRASTPVTARRRRDHFSKRTDSETSSSPPATTATIPHGEGRTKIARRIAPSRSMRLRRLGRCGAGG